MVTALVMAAAMGAAAGTALDQSAALTAVTKAPELIDSGPTGTTFLMTEERYREFVETEGKKHIDFVPITKTPAGLSPRARYGINLLLRRTVLSWIIDGDESNGYVLYADLNGNGDLTDDSPLRFERADGKYTLQIVREEREAGVAYPVSMKLVLDWVTPPGKTEKQLAMRNYSRTTRAGELVVPMAGSVRTIPFRLTGFSGIYDEPYSVVAFDFDRDGTFDPDLEVYRISDKFVNIGDTSYKFAVDPFGRSLTLLPLAEHLTGRTSLRPGVTAPGFSFIDLDRRDGTLAEYRGKVVLLDFWGVWCAPCVAEAPRLVALYEQFHDRGFEIIGIDTLDTREKVLSFVAAHKIRWRQTMEPDKGPLQTLFRVIGFPTYFIIGRDGRIVGGAEDSRHNLEAEVQKLFDSGSGSPRDRDQ